MDAGLHLGGVMVQMQYNKLNTRHVCLSKRFVQVFNKHLLAISIINRFNVKTTLPMMHQIVQFLPVLVIWVHT